jgi:hypothetical protein
VNFAGAQHLTVFMRNNTWIAPQIASDDQAVAEDGDIPAPAGKHFYTNKEKERFRSDPEFHREYRKRLESGVAKGFGRYIRGSQMNLEARKAMRESMLQKIGEGHEELKKNLIPNWSPGCRRLTVSRS